MSLLSTALAIPAVMVAGLTLWRQVDSRRVDRTWSRLCEAAHRDMGVFRSSMVDGLPDPARRFFLYTIGEGAPLRVVSEVAMRGEIGFGDKAEPRYTSMRGHQIIAPPRGFVWKLDAGSGLMRISGSDGFDRLNSWTSFWLMNIVPIVRVGGERNHARSAFGRVVAEAVFFVPAALLPHNGVIWEGVSADTALATVSFQGLKQTVDVSVDEAGRPHRILLPRWSNANPEKEYRIQPFGGTFSDFKRFDGYMLPTRIEGGNFIGTSDYFPFYKARIESVEFLP